MISEQDYFDLPEDPELAFLEVERGHRAKLQNRLDQGDNSSPYFEWYQDYINGTLGAANGLGIDYFKAFDVPSNRNEYYEDYRGFVLAIDNFIMQVRIRHSRRAKRYSVALDAAAKKKIRHHLNQLKDLTDKLEVSTRKREAIMARIIALEVEIERPRTRFDVVADFLLESSAVGGEVGTSLEPWRKWIETISGIFGKAKEADKDQPSLPLPEERKRIEPPKKKLPPPPQVVDDDIPF